MSKNKSICPYCSVPYPVLFYMAWRNIITKKLRSILTVAGVAIGIGSIFFLLSFGFGLKIFITDQLIGNKSIKSIDVSSQNSKIVSLNSQNIEKISNLPKVDKVGLSYSVAGKTKYNKSEINIVAYGMDISFQELSYLSLLSGRFIQKDDTDNVMLISKSSMEGMGVKKANQIIGQLINVNIPIDATDSNAASEINKQFKVIGVIDSSYGNEIFLPKSVFEKYNNGTYSQLKLSTASVDNIPGLRKQIESMGFITNSPIDTIEQVNQIFSYFNAILIGFGLIGMVIAVLGMLNTLTVSLIERVNEIGLLVSLGGRHKDMKSLFVLEAIILSIIGSVIGITIAIGLESGLNFVINKMIIGRGFSGTIYLFSSPIWLIFSLIIFMIFVGLIVSQIPARRASKINPVDSMRQQ